MGLAESVACIHNECGSVKISGSRSVQHSNSTTRLTAHNSQLTVPLVNPGFVLFAPFVVQSYIKTIALHRHDYDPATGNLLSSNCRGKLKASL